MNSLSNLTKYIIQKIKINGPITIADYMRIVLTAPSTGFYMKEDVFGRKGHFITSPEISQTFGELISVWLINEWQQFNEKEPFRIVELGPGRGTLIKDISRVLSKFGHSQRQTSIHLVEISPFLRQIQEKNLCGQVSVHESNSFEIYNSLTQSGLPVTWYSTIDQIPELNGFTAFIANEFFDALPIHKFQKTSQGKWREILIDYNDNNELIFIQAPGETPASKLLLKDPDPQLDHIEISLDAVIILDKVVQRLNRHDGCLLLCDYGYDKNEKIKSRNTFRAFRNHALWDPLKEPGSADLTADVNFGYLKDHLKDKSLIFGPVTQQKFLGDLGIGLRVQVLMSKADKKEREELLKGIKIIMEDMGIRFKFVALFPLSSCSLFSHKPPGFY